MARQARLDAPGVLHHVMARGPDRQRIFRDDPDREDFLRRVGALADSEAWEVSAWALIPNHFHLLVRTGKSGLSRNMRVLMSGYSGYFNRRHGRKGHVFQNRFKSVVCEEDEYFPELVRYLHLNPVRAGIVGDMKDPARYPYTGHSGLMGKVKRPWQAVDRVLWMFGENRRRARRGYERFVCEGIGKGRRPELMGGGLLRSQGVRELRRGRESYRFDERVLGSSAFVTALMEELDRRDAVPRTTVTLEELTARIGKSFGVAPEALRGGGRRRKVSEARTVLCRVWNGYLGRSGRELGRYLGISPQAVYGAVRRCEVEYEIAEEDLKEWLKK